MGSGNINCIFFSLFEESKAGRFLGKVVSSEKVDFADSDDFAKVVPIHQDILLTHFIQGYGLHALEECGSPKAVSPVDRERHLIYLLCYQFNLVFGRGSLVIMVKSSAV
ncbi:hypothetical protein TNIN_391891 [Trichonephila inaurata madagascariensis]|uniref:Uncharacterized protein n=1 Tax=Trichonephila inaurata madagascariensis TaxID=2747483 RepID=A0A8X7BZS6_9ARAC|nr:hypothetical protein TNIN_391891 [Trichonephila inaurata madagascariensis]